jgi:hypothetical protein
VLEAPQPTSSNIISFETPQKPPLYKTKQKDNQSIIITMKVLAIVSATLLAVASANSAAAPGPVPNAAAIDHFCRRPGQGCYKLKRAADGAAAALAVPEPAPGADASAIDHFCRRPGQGCYKAKRNAEALAAAIAEAYAVAEPEPEPGKQSSGLEARHLWFKPDDPATKAMLTHTPEAILHFCRRPGQGCFKVKRAAEAVAEALAEPEPAAEPEAIAIDHFCRRPGQGCYKAKRAAEALAKAAADAAADL